MRKKTSKENYILTLTKEQALTVSKACEFYSRVMMGQFGRSRMKP